VRRNHVRLLSRPSHSFADDSGARFAAIAIAVALSSVAVAAMIPACTATHDTGDGGGFVGVAGEASAPMGKCEAVEQQQAIEGWSHVPVCSRVSYFTNPPSSGNHYPVWAAYKSYASPVPRGFYVHDLEHGAIVLTYNCPNGCDADVAAAQAMIDALPTDADCAAARSAVRVRMVMTPDPELDVPFAASAWGWTLRAKCFDPDVFGAFVAAHRGMGRENVCGDGQDLSTGVVADCGDL
jgi:hypothetical protein